MRRSIRLDRPFAVFALAFALAGCSGDHHTNPMVAGRSLPSGTPAAVAADSATQRFMVAYTVGVDTAADTLLTSDFRYQFSAQSDPVLVTEFPAWSKGNELAALRHMIHGFTNSQGDYVPPVTSATFALSGETVVDDGAHADSTTQYRVVDVTNFTMQIDVANGDGTATYNLAEHIRFCLVRGDAAVIDAGQAHDVGRWYLREIDDLAVPAPGTPGHGTESPAATQATTWGKLRAQYH